MMLLQQMMISQQTRNVEPMLFWCWPTIEKTLAQRLMLVGLEYPAVMIKMADLARHAHWGPMTHSSIRWTDFLTIQIMTLFTSSPPATISRLHRRMPNVVSTSLTLKKVGCLLITCPLLDNVRNRYSGRRRHIWERFIDRIPCVVCTQWLDWTRGASWRRREKFVIAVIFVG